MFIQSAIQFETTTSLKVMKMSAKQRGGARPGAGRKPVNPEGRTATLAVTVPESLIAQLDELAVRRGWNRSEAVTEAIRQLLRPEQ
jgi:ribbon-helix-helix CopG family protein